MKPLVVIALAIAFPVAVGALAAWLKFWVDYKNTAIAVGAGLGVPLAIVFAAAFLVSEKMEKRR